MNVALENTRERFVGSTENGIQSKSLEVDDGSRTIRIGPIMTTCPIEMVEEMPSSTSFLQTGKRITIPSHQSDVGINRHYRVDSPSFIQLTESPVPTAELVRVNFNKL